VAKLSKNTFHENLLSDSQVFSCGQKDMAKLRGALLQVFVTSVAKRRRRRISPPVALILIRYSASNRTEH
jgi:hypothetical protein